MIVKYFGLCTVANHIATDNVDTYFSDTKMTQKN